MATPCSVEPFANNVGHGSLKLRGQFGAPIGKLKHKIFGEPVGIAFNGSVQGFGLSLIELRALSSITRWPG
jgi:hypothetical protein